MADIDWASLEHLEKDVLIPDGEYIAIVSEATATESSTGKPMLKLKLSIVEGPYRDRKVFSQLTLSVENPFAIQKWYQNLAAFGLDKEYTRTHKPTTEMLARELVNRGVVIVVGHHTFNGSDRNNIDTFRPYSPNGPTPPGMILGAARIPAGPQIGANPTVDAPGNAPNPASGVSSGPPTPTRAF